MSGKQKKPPPSPSPQGKLRSGNLYAAGFTIRKHPRGSPKALTPSDDTLAQNAAKDVLQFLNAEGNDAAKQVPVPDFVITQITTVVVNQQANLPAESEHSDQSPRQLKINHLLPKVRKILTDKGYTVAKPPSSSQADPDEQPSEASAQGAASSSTEETNPARTLTFGSPALPRAHEESVGQAQETKDAAEEKEVGRASAVAAEVADAAGTDNNAIDLSELEDGGTIEADGEGDANEGDRNHDETYDESVATTEISGAESEWSYNEEESKYTRRTDLRTSIVDNAQLSATAQVQRGANSELPQNFMLPDAFTEEQIAGVGKDINKPTTTSDTGGSTIDGKPKNPIGELAGVAMSSNPFSKYQTKSGLGMLTHMQVSGQKRAKTDKDPEERERTLLDDFTEGRVGANYTLPSLRPEYIIPGEDAVAMSAYEQLRGDIEFDLFSVVKDGFGLGATNQLHIDNQRREQYVRYKEKMFRPRAHDGPEMGMHPSRSEVHPTMSNREMARPKKKLKRLLAAAQQYVRALPGAASAQFLPDDNNSLMSSTGLGTRKPSPLVPHIDTHYYWQRQYDPAGIHMRNRQFRNQIDPLRHPQKASVTQKGTTAHSETWRRHPITYEGY